MDTHTGYMDISTDLTISYRYYGFGCECIYDLNRFFTFCREVLWTVSSICIPLFDRTGHWGHGSTH